MHPFPPVSFDEFVRQRYEQEGGLAGITARFAAALYKELKGLKWNAVDPERFRDIGEGKAGDTSVNAAAAQALKTCLFRAMLPLIGEISANLARPTIKHDPTNPPPGFRDWASLVEEVNLPQDLAFALVTQRPELLKIWKKRAFTLDESAAVVNTLRVYVETNAILQAHCVNILKRAEHIAGAVHNLTTTAQALIDVADFRQPLPSNET